MGDRLDQIDELAARSADELTPKEEGDLVELRRLAFEEVEVAIDPRPWPPEAKDPAPGVDGVFEVEPADLNLELVAGAVQHRGCIKINRLLDKSQVQVLRRDLRRSFQCRPDYGRPDVPQGVERWYRRFEADRGNIDNFGKRNHLRLADCPRGLSDVLRIYREVGLIEVITAYLGERPALSVNKSSMRRVAPSFALDYHQDGAFLGSDIRTINVWLALTTCGVNAPGLDLVPARMPSVLPTGINGAAFDWTVSEATVNELTSFAPVVRPSFHAGDVLLFDQMLLHRTGNSASMSQHRLAVESWFFAPSSYPDGHCPLMV